MSTQPPNGANSPASGRGPGETPVSVRGIALISLYFIFLAALIGYLLVKLWPHCSAISTATAPTACVEPTLIHFIWGGDYLVWEEIRLLMIVILTGALGGLLHSIRSLSWYVGNRRLDKSWTLMYLLLPFSGAILATALYFVVRAGFFPQAKADQSSPISFAAFGILSGLFSTEATLKLKQVFETLLTAPPPGAGAVPQQPGSVPPDGGGGAPVIVALDPTTGPGAGDQKVKITGKNFSKETTVSFGGTPAKSQEFESATVINAVTSAHAAGKVDVIVTNKDGKTGTASGGYTYQ